MRYDACGGLLAVQLATVIFFATYTRSGVSSATSRIASMHRDKHALAGGELLRHDATSSRMYLKTKPLIFRCRVRDLNSRPTAYKTAKARRYHWPIGSHVAFVSRPVTQRELPPRWVAMSTRDPFDVANLVVSPQVTYQRAVLERTRVAKLAAPPVRYPRCSNGSRLDGTAYR